jgi:hypothetical protein
VVKTKWAANKPTYSQKSAKKIRHEVMSYYCKGEPHCVCCGEKNYMFLTIDHINGGGRQHREVVKADKLPSWLKRNGYPEEYRILCYNCNNAHGAYGFCPHELERGIDVSARIKPHFKYLFANTTLNQPLMNKEQLC